MLIETSTLTHAYLYYEFAFWRIFNALYARTIENALKTRINSRQDHEYSYKMGSVSLLTNPIAYLEKSILKCVDSVIGKSNIKFGICYIILRKTILFHTSMFYFATKSV